MPHDPDVVFTLTANLKAAYKDELRAVLIGLARERQTITYSDLALRMKTAYLHPHSFTFAHLMRQVCAEELAKDHGMLCALIVSKLTGMPSGGYFKGMAGLGYDTSDLEARWREDVEDVFERWKDK